MFTGEYRPSVDEKGRITLPNKFRKINVDGSAENESGLSRWFFTYGYDRAIMGMPAATWDKFIEEKISPLTRSLRENRQRIRFLLSGAFDCELDKQGRFILPQNLRDYASIDKDLIIIGVGSYIEIWDKDSYEKEVPMTDSAIRQFAETFWS